MEDLKEIKLGLTFIATNKIETETFLDEALLFYKFIELDERGQMGIESCYIDSKENFKRLLSFLFDKEIELKVIGGIKGKELIDLSLYKNNCITTNKLSDCYEKWLTISSRENSMDEFGMLLNLIEYIKRNKAKEFLLLLVEEITIIQKTTFPRSKQTWWQKLIGNW